MNPIYLAKLEIKQLVFRSEASLELPLYHPNISKIVFIMENSGSKRSLRSWSITEKGKLQGVRKKSLPYVWKEMEHLRIEVECWRHMSAGNI